jgi:hypothetical protein
MSTQDNQSITIEYNTFTETVYLHHSQRYFGFQECIILAHHRSHKMSLPKKTDSKALT